MLSKRQLRRVATWAVDSPNLLARQVNRAYHTRAFNREFNHDGVSVVDEDWDTLIVLDACRYDLFEERHDLPGTLSARESRAAHTSEFILGNFHERDLTDTVYVTASPILERGYQHKYDPSFHAVVNVWQEDGWDDEYNTVLPETMAEYALETAERYPNKRLIVHFMQPHYPFVGSGLALDKETVPDPEEIETDVWHEMMRERASITREEITEAYHRNFDVVQPHVRELLDELSGKSVVTSDHGNMLGERARPIPIREWGHPDGVYTPELVTVPWLEYESGPRREVVAEAPIDETEGDDAVEDDVVTERLRNLGYAE
ncbi:hypothetical protein I7X12_00920 [Halosimplex litoreum]|uniref:Sulfatase n=1 Tax=Halosimplex litoreum TaxID=1198301 RepID=A0A7T3KVV7_9EURY|nr:hypothetical protein [Halosimplex litoreum]QPV63225.1 hypothetical protein I7X12_00920 [Halosimplex litoreum]